MSATNKPFYLTDVTQARTDDTCGMQYWYSTQEKGFGVTKADRLVLDLLDKEIHRDLRALADMKDISPRAIQDVIDSILEPLSGEDRQDTRRMELLYRRLGWFAAFALYVEPKIREDYETLPIDEGLVLDKDPLWVMTAPDRLLKSKRHTDTVYREYVPVPAGVTLQKWMQGWHYDIRLHLGLAAARESVAKQNMPTYGQIMGMSRGFFSVLDGRLVHPYIWGYKLKGKDEWSYTINNLKEGTWEPVPVWTFPGGIVNWVKMCGEGIANNMFQYSPAVYLNKDMLEDWVAQRIHREREINAFKEAARQNQHIRNVHFPRRTGQCRPGMGDECPYLHLCWTGAGSRDMLLNGSGFISNLDISKGREPDVIAQ